MPIAEGPWKLPYTKTNPAGIPQSLDRKNKSDYAKAWIQNLSPETICAYSDGSSSCPARSAWGYAVYKGNRLIGSDAGIILRAEVYDAYLLDQESLGSSCNIGRRVSHQDTPR